MKYVQTHFLKENVLCIPSFLVGASLTTCVRAHRCTA